MRIINQLAAAALLSFASIGAGHAADLLTVPVSAGPMEIPVAGDGFDWNGFYTGVYGVWQSSPVGGTQYGLGIDLGVNAQFDFVLVGGEVAFHGLDGGSGGTSYAQVLARGGLIITDSVLVYGAAGYGVDLGPPAEDDFLFGGGVELALADNLSLRAQYLHAFPLSGANPKDQLSFGANVHF